MALTVVDQIWNRAAIEGGGRAPRAGDQALSSLLAAHSLVMNGGVHHAIEVLSPEELSAAAKGFRYFGLDEVGSFLIGVAGGRDHSEQEANERYGGLIPGDESLAKRFQAKLERNPDEFAPVDAEI